MLIPATRPGDVSANPPTHRRMTFNPTKPCNDLPPLPPAAETESKPLLKACIETRAALADLKSVGALIPNQAVLINTIPLLEAQASSEIENIVTTTDALFRYSQLEDRAADPARARYRAAQHGHRETAGTRGGIHARQCTEDLQP